MRGQRWYCAFCREVETAQWSFPMGEVGVSPTTFLLLFSIFSSAMLSFIPLCNWAILWNSASISLVWLCWNVDVVAKLTVVSFPGFSIPNFPWFSGNEIQNLLLPCPVCCARFSLTTSADLLLHLLLLCPLSGGDHDFMPGSSHYNSFSECFVCLSVLCALQNSAVLAVLTADKLS